jgi:hypothetical protein
LNEQIWQRNEWLFSIRRKNKVWMDDRLNMVSVNLAIGAGLAEQAAGEGISGRLCNLKQPQQSA